MKTGKIGVFQHFQQFQQIRLGHSVLCAEDAHDQLRHIRVLFEKTHGCLCIIRGSGFHLGTAPEKLVFQLERKLSAVLMVDMCIQIGHHPRLRVAGISLHGLDIPAAELQLDRRAAMAQAVRFL